MWATLRAHVIFGRKVFGAGKTNEDGFTRTRTQVTGLFYSFEEYSLWCTMYVIESRWSQRKTMKERERKREIDGKRKFVFVSSYDIYCTIFRIQVTVNDIHIMLRMTGISLMGLNLLWKSNMENGVPNVRPKPCAMRMAWANSIIIYY